MEKIQDRDTPNVILFVMAVSGIFQRYFLAWIGMAKLSVWGGFSEYVSRHSDLTTSGREVFASKPTRSGR